MNTEEQQILNIKVKYEDAIYGIVRYREKIEELSKSQKQLKEDYKGGKVTYDSYVTSIAAMDEQTKTYKTTIRELSKEVQNNIKTEKEQEGSLRSLRAELSNATKAYDSLSEAERKGAKGQELKRHINDITDKLRGAEEETQRFQRSVGSYEDSIKSALGVNSNFANSILNMSENGKGLPGIFNGAITSAKAFGTTLLGFMTNPVFIALAGIAGAGVAFKWFYDYNKGIEESTRLTREFLGLTGDSLKAVRDEIQATADTYGKDYKETLEAVDVLTSQYGYDTKEALQIINDGFQSGADLNGDMIDKIKQYAPAFHDANISGKELVATIQQTRSGIFSDSGLALIQMGSKRIREMSTATAEALDGIGISSKQVQKDLENGTKSTYDVIKEISTKLKEVPQNSQEVGNVLKDVFGRQGANAGLKMIEQLDTMNTDLDKLKGTTGEYGEEMEKQRKANEELNNVLAAMFDMSDKGFGEMLIRVKTLTIQGITKLLKGLIDVINYFIDLYNQSLVFRGAIQAIGLQFKAAWAVIKTVFGLIVNAIKAAGSQLFGFGQILEGIFTLSFDKMKQGAAKIVGSFGTMFKNDINTFKELGKDVSKAFTDGINTTIKKANIQHIKIPTYIAPVKNNDDNKDDDDRKPRTKGKGKKKKEKKKKGITAEEYAKKETAEIRKAEDLLMQLVEETAEQRRKAIAVQYDRQIEDLKTRISTEKGLTINAKNAMYSQIDSLTKIKEKKLSEFDMQVKDEAIKREQVYIQNMLASVEKGSKEEYQLKIKQINDAYQLELDEANKQVMNEEEKNNLLSSITAKYYEEEKQAYEDYHNALIDKQTKAIEDRFKEKSLELQINGDGGEDDELAQLQIKADEKLALLEAAQQREGETIEQFNLRKLQLEADYQDAKKALKEEEQKQKEEAFQKDMERYQAVGSMMGSISELAAAFGEKSKGLAKASKALALAEIAINTGVAIAEGIKQAQKAGGFPANIVAIATTVAAIMSGITSAIKTVKSAKFAHGGLVTGEGTETSDSIPAQLSNGESVLTAQATRMFAPALSAFNQIGGGVPIIAGNANGQQLGEEMLARAFARGAAMLPNPVVSVEEISNTQIRIQTIERLSKL